MTRRSEIEPRFNKDGSFVLKTQRDRLAAAISTLRSVAMIPQAYYSSGPVVQVEEMRRTAIETLHAIMTASPDGWYREEVQS